MLELELAFVAQTAVDSKVSPSSPRRPGLHFSRKSGLALRKRKLDPSLHVVDFYQLLSVARDASLAEIKAAYHRALLQSHPDKRMHAAHTRGSGRADGSVTPVDIALLKEAYTVLANAGDRAAYDAQLRRRPHNKMGPRPAAVVSLEEFEVDRGEASAVGEDEDQGINPADNADEDEGPWRYSCRCGGWYRITASAMEKGQHLVGCSSCSEVIWVGYEVVSESESETESNAADA